MSELLAAGYGNGTVRLIPPVWNKHRQELRGCGVMLCSQVAPEECAHLFAEDRGDSAGFWQTVCANCGAKGPEMLSADHARAAFYATYNPAPPPDRINPIHYFHPYDNVYAYLGRECIITAMRDLGTEYHAGRRRTLYAYDIRFVDGHGGEMRNISVRELVLLRPLGRRGAN